MTDDILKLIDEQRLYELKDVNKYNEIDKIITIK